MKIENLQLKTPYAFDENKTIISITSATKEKSYTCISCSEKLILKAGSIKTKHFAHKNINCSPESIFHFFLKNSIKKKLKEDILNISHNCCYRQSEKCNKIAEIDFPEYDDVKIEFKLQNGYIPDVVCLKNNKPVFAIEIFHTHKVDKQKHINLGIPYVEISTEDYMEHIMEEDKIKDEDDFIEGLNELKVKNFNGIEMMCKNCLIKKNNLIKTMKTHNRLLKKLNQKIQYVFKYMECGHIIQRYMTKQEIDAFKEYTDEINYPYKLLMEDRTTGEIRIIIDSKCPDCYKYLKKPKKGVFIDKRKLFPEIECSRVLTLKDLLEFNIYKDAKNKKGRLKLDNAIYAKYDDGEFRISFPCIITKTKVFNTKIFHLKIIHHKSNNYEIVYFKKINKQESLPSLKISV